MEIGDTRQLFVDDDLIESMDNASLKLHSPKIQETAISSDSPTDARGVSYSSKFYDLEMKKFRLYYRAWASDKHNQGEIYTAYAESEDGVNWIKPDLGIIEYNGNKANNLIWESPGINMSVFLDENPHCPPEEKYKAVIRIRDGIDPEFFEGKNSAFAPDMLMGMVSSDGFHWKLLEEKPLLVDSPFDTLSRAFWDEVRQEYVLYTRGIRYEGRPGNATRRSFDFGREGQPGVRWIRRATSKDFLNWSELKKIKTGDAPMEHLYTNAAMQYPRAPQYFFMFPSRFMDAREPKPNWEYGPGVNDIVFLSSKDGIHFRRTFMDAWIRPGLDPGNWHDRSLFVDPGFIQTSDEEYSFFGTVNWRIPTQRIIRYSIRLDGFVSVNAPYEGGEMLTKPFVFQGSALVLNYSTSAAGSIQIQVEDPWGNPVSGFSFQDFTPIYGDKIDQPVLWNSSHPLSSLSGKPIRLRFRMKDADLFSLKFNER